MEKSKASGDAALPFPDGKPAKTQAHGISCPPDLSLAPDVRLSFVSPA
jgi:hypothetical protein